MLPFRLPGRPFVLGIGLCKSKASREAPLARDDICHPARKLPTTNAEAIGPNQLIDVTRSPNTELFHGQSRITTRNIYGNIFSRDGRRNARS